MEALMQITTNEQGIGVVSGKVLHGFLEIKTRFDQWIKRMFDYGFREGADYQCLVKFDQTPTGGRREIFDDYALTLDTAKHISMIQRTEKGMQARQYFIECEKKLTQVKDLTTQAKANYDRIIKEKDQLIGYLNQLIQAKDARIADARNMIEFHKTQGDRWFNYNNDTREIANYFRDLYRQETEISRDLRKKVLELDATKPASEASTAGSKLPPLSTSTKINRLVRQYAADHSDEYTFEQTWKMLYREFRDRFHIDPSAWHLKKGETIIGRIDQLGKIEELLLVAEYLFAGNHQQAA